VAVDGLLAIRTLIPFGANWAARWPELMPWPSQADLLWRGWASHFAGQLVFPEHVLPKVAKPKQGTGLPLSGKAIIHLSAWSAFAAGSLSALVR
jgi:hypothetical protein